MQGNAKITSISKKTNKTAKKKKEDLIKAPYFSISNPDSKELYWKSLFRLKEDNNNWTNNSNNIIIILKIIM